MLHVKQSRPRNNKTTAKVDPRFREAVRDKLLEALKQAVDGEHRFGSNENARFDLDQRWKRVIDALETLFG